MKKYVCTSRFIIGTFYSFAQISATKKNEVSNRKWYVNADEN